MGTSGLRYRPAGAGEAGRRARALLGAVLVVGAVLAGLVALRQQGDEARLSAREPGGPPPPVIRATDGAAVLAWGDETAPLLEVFTDYQCPDCRAAHDGTGPLLRRLASQGRVRVVYRPIQTYWGVAREPSASNSRRAAVAALCAPAPAWLNYHDALFAHQPAEGAPGFSLAQLIELAERSGIIGPDFPACLTGGAQEARLDALNRYAADRGVRGAPAAFLDGRPLDRPTQLDPVRLERAVHTARA
jgi:protein-disulfide isomerase